ASIAVPWRFLDGSMRKELYTRNGEWRVANGEEKIPLRCRLPYSLFATRHSLLGRLHAVARGRRAHRHQFLGGGRMQRHGGVEIGLGGAHLDGDGDHLDHLGGALAGDAAAEPAATAALRARR